METSIPSNPAELERRFEAAVAEMLREIAAHKHVTNHYDPTAFKNMCRQYGAVQAAKRLVIKPNQTAGFVRLCKSGLSHITLEALVLRDEFSALFSEEEIACARFHLHEQGC